MLVLLVGACSGDNPAQELMGRWEMVQGTDATFQFLGEGLLIGAMDNRQEIGSYDVIDEGHVLLMLDGDTLLADFEVVNDTLRLVILGQDERLVGIRREN
jgi:hypothetical protein